MRGFGTRLDDAYGAINIQFILLAATAIRNVLEEIAASTEAGRAVTFSLNANQNNTTFFAAQMTRWNNLHHKKRQNILSTIRQGVQQHGRREVMPQPPFDITAGLGEEDDDPEGDLWLEPDATPDHYDRMDLEEQNIAREAEDDDSDDENDGHETSRAPTPRASPTAFPSDHEDDQDDDDDECHNGSNEQFELRFPRPRSRSLTVTPGPNSLSTSKISHPPEKAAQKLTRHDDADENLEDKQKEQHEQAQPMPPPNQLADRTPPRTPFNTAPVRTAKATDPGANPQTRQQEKQQPSDGLRGTSPAPNSQSTRPPDTPAEDDIPGKGSDNRE